MTAMDALDTETVVGCTDGFKLGYIEGWAWRPLRPHDPVIVQLLVDGVPTAEATACLHRPDLQTAGIGNGHYAFSIPLRIEADGPPVLHVTVRAKDGPVLPQGTFDITSTPQEREDLSRRQSVEYLEQVFGPLGGDGPGAPATAKLPPAPRLNFILHSATAGAVLRDALGMPEYSYYFVMRSFREVLRRLGTVHVVSTPAEQVDDIHDACLARGESCVFLSFAPPQSTPLGLRCPTIPVIAWEFGTIPTGGWPGDAREDWRLVLRQTGRAITISEFAARAIRATMGDGFPVAFIPTPVWNRDGAGHAGSAPPAASRTIMFEGVLWDSRNNAVALDMKVPPVPPIVRPEPLVLPVRGAQLALAEFSAAAHAERSAAAAAAAAAARITGLPQASMRMALRSTAVLGRQWYREVLREVLPRPAVRAISVLGRNAVAMRARRRGKAAPAGTPPAATIELSVPPSAVLTDAAAPALTDLASPDPALPDAALPVTARYMPVDKAARPDAAGPRPRHLPANDADMLPEPTLATFLPDPYPALQARDPRHHAELDGIVFTAVLSPKDGRKNWQDIVSAFTAAFRDTRHATLVLKMIGADPTFWWSEFHNIVRAVPAFACRVVVLSGYLDDANYRALIGATHFVVNASLAEGQCLPLVEFMSAGRPAIAPLHTAMLDYISTENAVLVRSSAELCAWPHDPRNHKTTTRYRIDWPSLRDAFAQALQIAQDDAPRYARMGQAASASMRAYCADDVVGPRLAAFLGCGDEAVLRAGWRPVHRAQAEPLLEPLAELPA